MPVKMYEEWLQESEKVDPQAPAEVPAAPPTDQVPAEAPAEVPAEPTTDVETGLETQPEETTQTEQEEFEEIDAARKEAITAFKDKQKEFMEIPQEIQQSRFLLF